MLKKIMILLIALLSLSACPRQITNGFGRLQINIGQAGIRSVVGPDMDIASYTISGTHIGGDLFGPETIVENSTEVILRNGSWTIQVDGKNQEDTIIGRGSEIVVLFSGKKSIINIVLTPLTGEGTLDLTIGWNDADAPSANFEVAFNKIGGASYQIDVTMENETATYVGSFVAGYYTIIIQYYDGSDLLSGVVELVRIAEAQTTFVTADFLQVNPATLEINISLDLKDPLTVNLMGALSQVDVGESFVITASLIMPSGSQEFFWYLEGVLLSSGSTFEVSNTLLSGVYRIDVIAVDLDKVGIATHSFMVGNVVTLAWDPPLEGPAPDGYRLYVGFASGIYEYFVDVGNKFIHRLTGLTNQRYYFAATAYNEEGESDFSNEVFYQ